MSVTDYDIAVIGGGPSGYSAALRAAQLGLKVALIEKDKVGGACLHRGCIPATSLLQCANMLESIGRAGKFGISVEGVAFDWKAVQKAKDIAIKRLLIGLNSLLKNRGVEVMKASARLSEPGVLKIEGDVSIDTLRARNIIIATGSMPQNIPELQGNSGYIMNTTDALEITEIPKSITIIGGGAYGVEFASLFRSFGAEVSIIEMQPRLLPRDDPAISKHLEKAFAERGIAIHTGVKLEEAQIIDDGVSIEISDKDGARRTIVSDKLLVTIGRTANTDAIDIKSLGIETRDGFIVAGDNMQTSVENIYAVGDVTHNPQFANYAFAEGIHAAETIAGLSPPTLNLKQIPIYTFGYPEIAKVGYTEEEARDAGFEIEVVELPFQTLPRSVIAKDDTGYVKIVSEKNGPLIGIHLIGPDVINLIPEAMLITNWEATVADLAQFLHPHPTFAEALGEAVLKLAGKPLHVL
ncbi:MAG: dihydrolipoyl dehydrogenase [Actinomycetota bacterium]|nr:dihydrolipoyl dehydrogenase [Actinomycetota bacterium]